MKRFTPIAILLPFLLCGCYHEIDLDKYRDQEGENMIVLNSLCNPDSVVTVSATRPFFYVGEPTSPQYISDLDMSLSINDGSPVQMRYDSQNHRYTADYKPNEGDKLRFSAREKNGNHAEAQDIVPRRVKIENITASLEGPTHVYTEQDYIITYNVTFTDPIEGENYYFIQYDSYPVFLMMGERNFEYEYVFQQLANEINGSLPGWVPYSPYGLPFSDKGINGKQHSLVLREIVQTISPLKYDSLPRNFQLYSISKDYYDYMISILRSNGGDSGLSGGLIDLGLSEPTKIFSNIEGGTGILGCYVLDQYIVDVRPLLK